MDAVSEVILVKIQDKLQTRHIKTNHFTGFGQGFIPLMRISWGLHRKDNGNEQTGKKPHCQY
jgi:hypothetical protein